MTENKKNKRIPLKIEIKNKIKELKKKKNKEKERKRIIEKDIFNEKKNTIIKNCKR